MTLPLMPKATAVWLVENTTLTFEQIAQFCGMHPLEVQAIADGEVAAGMHGIDPVSNGQLTAEELARCAQDPRARLKIAKSQNPRPKPRQKGARYTPVSKRQDRPDAIAWLVKNYPELSDAQIARLIGTTKPTILAVREKSHWNAPNIKPQNPINLGLCTEEDLERVVRLARSRARTAEAAKAKAEPPKDAAAPAEGSPETPQAEAPRAETQPGEGQQAETPSSSPSASGA